MTLLLGSPTEPSGTLTLVEGHAQSCQYTAEGNGTLHEVVLHLTEGSTAKSLRVAILTNNGETPKSELLGPEGVLTASLSTAGEYKVTGLEAAVVGADVYWIVILPIGGDLKLKQKGSGGTRTKIASNTSLTKISEIAEEAWGTNGAHGPLRLEGLGEGSGAVLGLVAARSESAATGAIQAQGPVSLPLVKATAASASALEVIARGQLLLGSTSEATGAVTFAAGHAQAIEYTAEKTGTIEEVLFHTAGIGSTATSVRVAVFANTGPIGENLIVGEFTVGEEEIPQATMLGPEGVLTRSFNEAKAYEVGGLEARVIDGEAYWIVVLPIGGTLELKWKGSGGTFSRAATNTSLTRISEIAEGAWGANGAHGPMRLEAYGRLGAVLGVAPATVQSSGALAVSAPTRIVFAPGLSLSSGKGAINGQPASLPLSAALSLSAATATISSPPAAEIILFAASEVSGGVDTIATRISLPLSPAPAESAGGLEVRTRVLPLHAGTSNSTSSLQVTVSTRVGVLEASGESSGSLRLDHSGGAQATPTYAKIHLASTSGALHGG
jgi:hypothetical protein